MTSIARLKDRARKHEQREDWRAAIEVYRKVLELEEAEASTDLELGLFNRVGDLYLRLGNTDEAVEYYERAADKYAESGFYNSAIALCNKALRHRPDRPEIFLKLSRYSQEQGFGSDARRWILTYAEKQVKRGKMDAALEGLEEFLRTAEAPDVRELLAAHLAGSGRVDEAMAQFHQAHAEWLRRGETDEATRVAEQIRALDPDVEIDPEAGTVPGASQDLPGFDEPVQSNGGLAGLETHRAHDFAAEPSGQAVDGLEGIVPGDSDVEPLPLLDGDLLEEEEPEPLPLLDTDDADDAGQADPAEEPLVGEEDEAAGEAAWSESGAQYESEPADEPEGELAEPQDWTEFAAEHEPEAELGEPEAELGEPEAELGEPEAAADGRGLLSEEWTHEPPDSEEEAGSDFREQDGWPAPEEESAEGSPESTDRPDGLTEAASEHWRKADEGAGASPAPGEAAGDPAAPGGEGAGEDDRPWPQPQKMEPIDLDLGAGFAVGGPVELSASWDEDADIEPLDLDLGGSRQDSAPELADVDVSAVLDRSKELVSRGLLAEALSELRLLMGTDAGPGVFREALMVLNEVIRRKPTDVTVLQRRVEFATRVGERSLLIDTYTDLADAMAGTGETERAETMYRRVLALDPENEAALAALGDDAEAQDDALDFETILRELDEDFINASGPQGPADAAFAAALSEFQSQPVRGRPPEDAGAHYDLGLAFKEMGLIDEAIAEFRKSLEGGQERLKVYEELGHCYMLKNEHEVAIKILQRALKAPRHAERELLGVYYTMGRCHEELGQRQEARSIYEKVLAIDPGFADVPSRMSRL